MDWPRSRLELLKTDVSEIVVMIGETIGVTIAEVAGEMIAAVTTTAAMIAETTEEMIGVNLMMIAETLLRISRHRLPLQVKEQGPMIETITRMKTLRTRSSPP